MGPVHSLLYSRCGRCAVYTDQQTTALKAHTIYSKRWKIMEYRYSHLSYSLIYLLPRHMLLQVIHFRKCVWVNKAF